MTKNKGGRPQKEINRQEFEKLCGLQCTKSEICGWFDTTDKTLESWCKRTYGCGFSDIFSKKREIGKIALRRSQFQMAEKNASMAIFLGKQYLGQKETVGDDNNSVFTKLDAIASALIKAAQSDD